MQIVLTNINIARLHTNANLTYLNLQNRSWVKKFAEKNSRQFKLRIAAGLAHDPQLDIPLNSNYPLCQNCNVTPAHRKTLMIEHTQRRAWDSKTLK